jgi:hypothetical protein
VSTDLATSNSLAVLAARIRDEHEATTAAMKRGAEHAINAGRLLNEARSQVSHGQWLPWLREHCRIPERTAQLYMRLARNAPELEKRNVADLTVRGALELLAPEDEHDAIQREGQRLADNVRAANANFVNVYVEKCQKLRRLAGMIDEFGDEADQKILLDKINETEPRRKWRLSQVRWWKKRTDEQAHFEAWQLLAEWDAPDEELDSVEGAVPA